VCSFECVWNKRTLIFQGRVRCNGLDPSTLWDPVTWGSLCRHPRQRPPISHRNHCAQLRLNRQFGGVHWNMRSQRVRFYDALPSALDTPTLGCLSFCVCVWMGACVLAITKCFKLHKTHCTTSNFVWKTRKKCVINSLHYRMLELSVGKRQKRHSKNPIATMYR